MSIDRYPFTERQLDGKVFFLHLPKTGGTTFAAVLAQHFDPDVTFPHYLMDELPKVPLEFIRSCRYFRGHFYYDVIQRILGEDPTCLTMLRDPVERFLSNFGHMKRRAESQDAPQVYRQIIGMSISEFVQTDLRLNRDYWNRQTQLVAAQLPMQDLSELASAVIGRNTPRPLDIELGKRRLETFSFVGITEKFTESLSLLAYTFGLAPVIQCQRLNVAPTRPRFHQIPPATLDRIAEGNSLDRELHAHALRILESRFSEMTYDLLDRYGTKKHAHLPLPLSQEALNELLERHFEACYQACHRPVRTLDFSFGGTLSGANWHDVEKTPEGARFRWTGPELVSRLDLPLAHGGDLDIEISAVGGITDDVLKSLNLEVNRCPVPLESQASPEGSVRFRGRVLGSALTPGQGLARLSFQVCRTVAPCDLDPANRDIRRLGVALSRLEIRPASGTGTAEVLIGSADPRLVVVADVGGKQSWHVGDEAMLEANLGALRQFVPKVRFTVLSRDPGLTSSQYGVESIPPFGFPNSPDQDETCATLYRETLKSAQAWLDQGKTGATGRAAAVFSALAESDGLLISGGGNLSSSWPGHLYERLTLIQIAKLFGKPAVMLGQTIGPNLSLDQRKVLREVLPALRLVGVREEDSAALVHSLGVPPGNILAQLDDAFWIGGIASEVATTRESNFPSPPWIGVTANACVDLLPGSDGLPALAEELKKIVQATGAKLVFIPHDAGPEGNPEKADREIGEQLYRLLAPSLPMTLAGMLSGSECQRLTAEAALVISTRYHPIVFGLSAAVPSLGIYVDEYTRVKLQGALAHCGLQEWSLPIELALEGRLSEAAIELWERRVLLASRLKASRLRWQAKYAQHWTRVLRAFGISNSGPKFPEVDEEKGDPACEAPGGSTSSPQGSWSRVVRRWEARQHALVDSHRQLFLHYERTLRQSEWLESALRNRDEEIVSLKSVVAAHATELQSVKPVLEVREKELSSIRQVLDARQRELASVKPALEAREKELASIRPVLQAREEELASLKPALQDREKELAALKPILQAREKELDSLKPVLRARDEELASLRPALQAREKELVSLKSAVQTREEELATLRPALQTRDQEIASLKPILQAREEELASLKPVLQARERELDFLKPVLRARDEELASLRPALQAREKELASLRSAAQTREEELASLRPALQTRDREIASLKPILQAREEELASLKPVLQARNEELDSLKPVLQARNEELASLKPILQAREEELASLKPVLQARNEELASLKPVLQARDEELAQVKSLLLRREGELHLARAALELRTGRVNLLKALIRNRPPLEDSKHSEDNLR